MIISSVVASQAIDWHQGRLRLLDQRLLPGTVSILEYEDVAKVVQAIQQMVVRGAPLLGIVAAYAVVLAARNAWRRYAEDWWRHMEDDLSSLYRARPTAVNLAWAVGQMRQAIDRLSMQPDRNPEPELLGLAQSLHHQQRKADQAMGHFGADQIEGVCAVITHCNAGALATGGCGTALGVIRCLHLQRRLGKAYASETRPWLQGARLTAWELRQDGVPVNLMADAATAALMAYGKVDWLIVGADRIMRNGDVVNKIGTCSHAIVARYYGVRVMVVAPVSSIDLETANTDEVPIEHRDASELCCVDGRSLAPRNIPVWNPVFDVTPAELIDVIVTEQGAAKPAELERISRQP